MKTRYWLGLIGALALVCGALTWWLFGGSQNASAVEIWSEGELVYTLPLGEDRTVVIQGSHGTNTVRIENGAVAVVEADCPDGHCMQRGFCAGGAQIVCLPNELVIRFLGKQTVDGTVG